MPVDQVSSASPVTVRIADVVGVDRHAGEDSW
jgi:hypothetical protein